MRKKFMTWMTIVIGAAARKGASEDEIKTLVKAYNLAEKYFPGPDKKELEVI